MVVALPLLLAIFGGFLLYQGLAWSGAVGFPALYVPGIADNGMLMLARAVICQYGVLLGLLGLGLAACLLICSKAGVDAGRKSFVAYAAAYFLLALFSVV